MSENIFIMNQKKESMKFHFKRIGISLLGVLITFSACRKAEEDNPLIAVNPGTLSFENELVTKTVNISNIGTGKLNYNLSSTNSWLVMTPSSGDCTAETDAIVVSISTTGLDYGPHDGSILVNTNGGQAQSISVTLAYTAPNAAPVADFKVTPQTGSLIQEFEVNAGATTDDVDAAATILIRWQWEEGGNYSEWTTTKTAKHTYSSPGEKKIILEAKDSKGLIGSTFRNIIVGENDAPKAEFSVTPEEGTLSTTFQVDASESTDDIDATKNLKIRWQWEEGGNFTTWTTVKTASYNYNTSGTKIITVEVKDAMDEIGSTKRNVVISANNPPEVSFSYSPTNVYAGSLITVTATATDDNTPTSNLVYKFIWDNTDSTSWISSNMNTHTYNSEGEKTITVKVRDAHEGIGISAKNLNVLPVGLPAVTLTAVTSNEITHNAAILRGNLTTLGDGATQVSEHGFCWSESTNPDVEISQKFDLGNINHTGTFAYIVTGLASSKTYYARAYARNSGSVIYSSQVSFITTIPQPDNAVETGLAYNVASTSATLNGTVQNLGIGVTIEELGMVWSTDAVVNIDNGTALKYNTIPTTVPLNFLIDATGLPTATVVYFRAYIKTNGGYIYGQTRSFTTLSSRK